MASDTSWMANSTAPDNATIIPPNSPVFQIPPNAGRSLQPDIAACAIITLLIATVFVALRFYTRGRVNHVLSASDWCILPALVRRLPQIGSSHRAEADRFAALRGWGSSQFS